MNQQERDEYLSFGRTGNGWLPIIKELDKCLSIIDPNYEIYQVKEKFGGLRFYFGTETKFHNAMEKLVDGAEELCWKTCEACGSMENVTTEGSSYYLKTACADHR